MTDVQSAVSGSGQYPDGVLAVDVRARRRGHTGVGEMVLGGPASDERRTVLAQVTSGPGVVAGLLGQRGR